MVRHVGQRLHRFIRGFWRTTDAAEVDALYARTQELFRKHGVSTPTGRTDLVFGIASDVATTLQLTAKEQLSISKFVLALCDYEELYLLPDIDFSEPRTTSQYWELKDQLREHKALAENFAKIRDAVTETVLSVVAPIANALKDQRLVDNGDEGLTFQIRRIDRIPDIGICVEEIMGSCFSEQILHFDILRRLRRRLNVNMVVASGGNPDDTEGYTRQIKTPSKSDISRANDLVGTYLGGTPLLRLFDGEEPFVIPQVTRFEHHHIVAGSGHGKTQTLQYLIAKDIEAVARGERSIVVLDSQGDLIRNIARLQCFAPGQPLHDRVVIIDPTDVEWPVSLNLFDVGLERLNAYSQLDRERLTNSILELYDFVLGSLLDASMTQKQNIIFRYVTRLMLHIPNATIHTLRELMEPKSEETFAEHIAKLQGTARRFFETEFADKEFTQTRRQVLRRLWGILENQTFERMFSHPRSKLDLFTEMNVGKVILINTAKDLLKETGTEIFGRFFIALIAQAAQERATQPVSERMPTYVYIDEAADYFDRNIGLILSQARKFNVGMVLAHQYLGQLDPRLLEAFSANTSIKFAGGVSAKDARTMAAMMGCDTSLIETQQKGSFAASVRSVTKSALSLSIPFGHLEALPQMDAQERRRLREVMRGRYAVHYTDLEGAAAEETSQQSGSADHEAAASPRDLDAADTSAKPTW